jgi:hypothetical protein
MVQLKSVWEYVGMFALSVNSYLFLIFAFSDSDLDMVFQLSEALDGQIRIKNQRDCILYWGINIYPSLASCVGSGMTPGSILINGSNAHLNSNISKAAMYSTYSNMSSSS